MTSWIATIAIDSVNPRPIADFWCAVLDWKVLEEDEGIISIGPADGSGPTIDVIQVPETKTVKNRLHLDLRTQKENTAAEVDRLLALGAKPADVGQAPDVSWLVLTDPEGNEFCLLGGNTA